MKVFKFSISIPLWADCKVNLLFAKKNQEKFQFHYGLIVRKTEFQALLSKRDFNSTMG